MEDTTSYIIDSPKVDLIPYVNNTFDFLQSNYPTFFHVSQTIIGWLIGLSIPVSVILFLGIIITVERLKSIRNMEDKIYNAKADDYTGEVPHKSKGNPDIARKWDMVMQHVESQNPNDWRQAVLEADIILGELLTKMGYKGDGIGEQLKRATKADFNTLDEAWEAHKVRNEIAHAGSDFSFNQFDARRVIQLYRKVFEEFFYI